MPDSTGNRPAVIAMCATTTRAEPDDVTPAKTLPADEVTPTRTPPLDGITPTKTPPPDDATPTKTPPPDVKAPWSDFEVAAAQTGIAAGLLGAAAGVSIGAGVFSSPLAGCCTGVVAVPIACVAAPYFAVQAADAFGSNRGAVLWPMIAFNGGVAVSAIGFAIIAFTAISGFGNVQAAPRELYPIGFTIVIVGAVAAIASLPVTYAWTSVKKKRAMTEHRRPDGSNPTANDDGMY